LETVSVDALRPVSTTPRLNGRADELALIQEFLDRLPLVGGALMLLGEPGVGKTALLNAAFDAASRTGMRVLSAAGTEFEADMTFSTLHQALDPLRHTFAQLSGPHREALNIALGLGEGSVPERLVVATATLALLREAATERPVLVVVDDLTWVDRASAKVMGFVARRLAGSRIGFLAAARPQEESVFDRAGVPSVELRPLDDEASATLVSTHFPALAPRARRTVLETAQGNPLALLEFGAALTQPRGRARQAPGPVLSQSRRLQTLYAARIEQLPAPARSLLLVLSLDGSRDLRVLEGIAAAGRFRDQLAVVQEARLVYVDDGTERVEFRHPLIRGAAVELASDEERRRAHLALAAVFKNDPDRQAWHLSEAATAPNEPVAAQIEQAGRRSLRRGDAVGAVSALTRAARLSPAPADRGRRLAEAAYIGADVTGEVRGVSALLADADRTGVDQGASLETASAAAFALLIGDGDVDTAHGLLVGAIEHRAETDDTIDTALEEALHTLLRVCYFGGRAELWEPLERALDRLGANAPAGVEIRAKTQGDPAVRAAEALPRLDAAISALARETDPTRIIRVATASSFVDRLPGCRQPLRRLVRDGRAGGSVSAVIGGLILLGLDDFWTGQWDEAEDLCDQAVHLCVRHGYTLYTPSARHVQALVAAARGDYARVRSLTDVMLQFAAPRRIRSVQFAAWHARTLAALSRGDYEDAYQEAIKITVPGVLGSHNPYVLFAALDLVDAAARSNRSADGASHARLLQDVGIGQLSSRLMLAESGSAAIAADDETAIPLFERALATPGIDRWPFDLARVQLAFGERLRRVRAARESRVPLIAALETFERLDAKPWAGRAEGELRASGQLGQANRGRDRASLTPQERQVAELAAAGLTNKEIGQQLFLSHRTVSGHLHRIFPKLGITSRAALRDGLSSIMEDDETANPGNL
jgi:DNA-binding CsgD family transcriptional regulator